MQEFEWIANLESLPQSVELGIGDDAAIVSDLDGFDVALCMDTMVEGVHFFAEASPQSIGYKILAVNLSDLAAMGAKPHAFLLALTLKPNSSLWLQDFKAGLLAAAKTFCIKLIGGDTTAGSACVLSVQAMGLLPKGQSLRRSFARAGQDVYVSGSLGEAAFWVDQIKNQALPLSQLPVHNRLDYPIPRLVLGQALIQLSSEIAAIDLSDGLIGDLSHIMRRSGVGFILEFESLPLSNYLVDLPFVLKAQLALAGGDDYELCFTADVSLRQDIKALQNHLNLPLTRIGSVIDNPSLQVRYQNQLLDLSAFKAHEHTW
jgi:thiamine-monophosphate kinase